MPCSAVYAQEQMDDLCFSYSPFLTSDLIVKTPIQAKSELKKYCYVATRYNAWISANDQFAWVLEGSAYNKYIYDKNGIWIPWPNLLSSCGQIGADVWYKP